MSQLKVNTIRHTGASSDAIELASDGSCTVKATNNLSNRNLVINGAMQVAQRGSSFTDISNESGKYILDRFEFKSTGTAAWTVAQSTAGSVLANTGFAEAVKIDCTTADTSLSTNQEIFITQKIEAQNLQHLRYGQSAAKSLTLSFWTRSNKTGDYGIWCYAQDGPRQYATTYTISSADTWEKKVITIPGDTSGTINNDNGSGFEVRFYLAAGPTHSGTPSNTWTSTINNRTTTLNLADSTSNEWYLTGLQLEVGDVATDFEHRSYGDELARCQRYFEALYMNAGTHGFQSATSYGGQVSNNIFAVTKRAQPTFSLEGDASWVGATPNVFTDPHNFIFHHGSTAFTISDPGSQDLCGSFSAEI